MRVVLDKPAELGLGQLASGVVEDDARLRHIEILVEVV